MPRSFVGVPVLSGEVGRLDFLFCWFDLCGRFWEVLVTGLRSLELCEVFVSQGMH